MMQRKPAYCKVGRWFSPTASVRNRWGEVGLSLIDAGHFATENPVVSLLAQKITERFPEIQVKISQTHTDCVKFF